MPDAGELFGGFWGDTCPSPVIDSLADAYSILSSNVISQTTTPRTFTFVIYKSDAVTAYAINSRAVTGYPAPAINPVWISPSSIMSNVLAVGVDYKIINGLIEFDVDPFTVYVARSDWSAGVLRSAITLWYGAAPTSDNTDTNVDDTFAKLTAAVATAYNSPQALANETVESVFGASKGYQVITDKNVYQLRSLDLASVSTGSVLVPGRPLGSAWTLTRLGASKPAIAYLTTPAYFNQNATTGGITWYDELVPLIIDVVSGRTRVRFKLGAASQIDLDAFWTASHANGLANGRTLAQALDTRTGATNDPDATSLPTQVNPLVLVCSELLGGNAWLLIGNTTYFNSTALSLATRQAAINTAAGPYTTVFVYDDVMPALTRYTPS